MKTVVRDSVVLAVATATVLIVVESRRASLGSGDGGYSELKNSYDSYDAPIPYMYGYGAQTEDGGHHSHREVSDGLSARGSFTQTLADGRTRTTEYVADEKGFRVVAMKDVYWDSNAIPSPRPTVKPIKDEIRPRWNPTRTRRIPNSSENQENLGGKRR